MISCMRPQELRSDWNSGAFHTRRMIVGEEGSASFLIRRCSGKFREVRPIARKSLAETEVLPPTAFPPTPRQRAPGTVCGRAGECRVYADGSRKSELCAREAKRVPPVAGPGSR